MQHWWLDTAILSRRWFSPHPLPAISHKQVHKHEESIREYARLVDAKPAPTAAQALVLRLTSAQVTTQCFSVGHARNIRQSCCRISKIQCVFFMWGGDSH